MTPGETNERLAEELDQEIAELKYLLEQVEATKAGIKSDQWPEYDYRLKARNLAPKLISEIERLTATIREAIAFRNEVAGCVGMVRPEVDPAGINNELIIQTIREQAKEIERLSILNRRLREGLAQILAPEEPKR